MTSNARERLYDRIRGALDDDPFDPSDLVAAFGAIVETARLRYQSSNVELVTLLGAVLTVKSGDDIRGAVTSDELVCFRRDLDASECTYSCHA